MPVEVAAIGLGSNLGNRIAHLRFGLSALRRLLCDVVVSRVYETEPREVVEQPRFLNACCVGRTRQTPRQLLEQLQQVELLAGRRRAGPRYGPRVLDLDLLLHGTTVIETPDLVVPHPRLRERPFVLVPLAELVPHWVVPASGGRVAATVEDLAQAAGARGVESTEIELT